MRIGVVSLGCAKNLVDSEVLLAKLKGAGAELTPNLDEADCIVVNTCGFVEEAKIESVEAILEAASRGKRILVMGCLVERYRKELEREIPEVEGFFGTESWDEILEHLGLSPRTLPPSRRILTTPSSYAYVKIAEGCNRLCSFCAIPAIRGRHRSRSVEEIVAEVEELARQGVKEILLVSQDTTYYGRDTGADRLPELLKKLEAVNGVEWIRLLYLYPTELTPDLLNCVKDSAKILPYFDIPLQHVSDKVLKSMRRGYGEDFVRRLIEKIRREIPDAVLRTTLLVGYPEEDRQAFLQLRSFVEEGHFHWLGVFAYSREEGTSAYSLGDPVPPEEKEERLAEIMEIQRGITARKNREFKGRRLRVLVDGASEEFSFVPVGRAYLQAPEVDGCVYLESEGNQPGPGEFVEVEITQTSDYDLAGRII